DFERGRRARTVFMMRIVKRNNVNQHQVRLVGGDHEFAAPRAPSIRSVVTSRPCSKRFGEQSWRRILGSPLSSGRTLFWVRDLRDVVVDIRTDRYRPSDVRSYQTRFLRHAPESLSLQSLRE